MNMKLTSFLAAICVLLAGLLCLYAFRFSRVQADLADAETRLSEAEAENRAAKIEGDALRRSLDGALQDGKALRDELAEASASARALPAEEPTDIQATPSVRSGSLTEHALVTPHLEAFRYLLYDPGISASEPLPLLLFLHGSGGCGKDIEDVFSDDTLPTMLQRGWLSPDALVLIPQCPGDSWDPYCEDLMALVEYVTASSGADPDRISLTGFSLGGIGCFTLLCRYPDFFSAAMPISAVCEEPSACAVITSTPVRILHGEKDSVMESRYVVLANDIINAAGGKSTLTFLPGEGHFIQQHYLDDGGEPIQWLITQRRSAGG